MTKRIKYKDKEYDSKEEFKLIILEYIFPLLGIKDNNLTLVLVTDFQIKDLIYYYDEKIYFFPFKNSKFGYYINVTNKYSSDTFNCQKEVLIGLVRLSYNNLQSTSKTNYNYNNISHCFSNYKYSVQLSICKWLFSSSGNVDKINRLIDILDEWSSKTYEGRKVPFGFLINLNEISENGIDYISFLRDEYSATISDGITSLVELDRNGHFLKYNSITENNRIDECDLNNCLPLRFSHSISKFVKGNKIGIFLLTPGDIIIAKNKKIEVVKRNGRWLNFNYMDFINAMSKFKNTETISDRLLEEVFSTSLDVSFSHAGGIIAIVESAGILKDKNGDSILSISDDLSNGLTDEEIRSKFEKENKNEVEINKRLLKRNAIKNLLSNNTNFCKIDRKLRSELVSLDGATIINREGNLISFGAIIQNDSGSSGGGRGAATRKLSNFRGMAIKISTDGYIEVYIDGEIKYNIK